jgi:hypothetical protein
MIIVNDNKEYTGIFYKENELLWEMVGTRQNNVIKWEAVPRVVKSIDTKRHMIMFYRMGGVSFNGVGKIYFTTKKECESHWLENHQMEEAIDYDEPTPEGIEELPRTNWDDYVVGKDDTVDSTAVYKGGMTNLENITDTLKWNADKSAEEYIYIPYEYLTLKEISDQVGERMITVIVNGPLKTTIFQYGNYLDAGWVCLGEIMGYA